MNKIDRRTFLKTIGAVSLGSLALYALPGCGTRGTNGEQVGEFTGKLNLLLGSHMDFIEKYAPLYKEKYGVEPKIEKITTQDLRNKLSSTFVARTSPWDAVFVIPDVISPFASRGWFHDLSDRVINSKVLSGDYTLVEAASRSGYYNGKCVAVPVHIGCTLMMWNKKLMQERDLDPEAPAKWHSTKNSYEQFVEYAKKMTFEQGGTQYYGYVDNWAGENVLFFFIPLVQMHGGQLMDEDERPLMNSEAGVEALAKMVDLLHTHKCIDPASLTYAWVFDCAPGFLNGTRGILITWPFMANEANKGDKSSIKGQVGCAPNFAVETSASIDSSEYFAIPVFAENVEEAWRWIELITSYEVQKEIGTTTGWFPIYEEVLSDPEVVANNPIAPILRQAYQYPAMNYRTPNFAEWATILANCIHDALAKRAKPKDALDDAVKKITNALKK